MIDREPTREERLKYPQDRDASLAKVAILRGALRWICRSHRRWCTWRTKPTGGSLVVLPLMGGSTPMYIFENLGLPVISVPIANYDDNQHSPNENLRLGHFWRGIELFAALLADLNW